MHIRGLGHLNDMRADEEEEVYEHQHSIKFIGGLFVSLWASYHLPTCSPQPRAQVLRAKESGIAAVREGLHDENNKKEKKVNCYLLCN